MISTINKYTEVIDRWVLKYKITRFFTSYVCVAFFYGIFLFLYELKFLREIIPAIHPVFIFWAGFVAIYNVVFRKCFTEWPHWILLFLFSLGVVLTSVANYETGIVQNIKVCILVILPLIAFYPICLIESKERRECVLIKVIMGASIVVFLSSAMALGLYMVRFGEVVSFMGIESTIGIQLYDPRYADSGLLLYGLYVDTNHAAVYAIIFTLYSVLLYHACGKGLFTNKWQNAIGRIYAVANLVVQICYFPLANSRGAWLCLGVAGFIILTLFFYNNVFLRKKFAVKMSMTVILALVCVAIVAGGLSVLRTSESKLSVIIEQALISSKVESDKKIEIFDNIETPQTTEAPAKVEIRQPEVKVDTFEKMNDEVGAGRIQIWKEVPSVLVKKPILGTGAGNHQYYAKKYDVGHVKLAKGAALHNSYLELLLSYGVVGFVTLMSFWGLCFWSVLQTILKGQNKISVAFYIIAFVVLLIAGEAMLLSNIFINTTAMYYIMVIMTGYLLAECKLDKKK